MCDGESRKMARPPQEGTELREAVGGAERGWAGASGLGGRVSAGSSVLSSAAAAGLVPAPSPPWPPRPHKAGEGGSREGVSGS